MESKEIIKALRRGLFSNELLQISANTIEELENKIDHLQTENEELKTQVSYLLTVCERVDKRIKTAEKCMHKKIADKLTTILLKAMEVDDK